MANRRYRIRCESEGHVPQALFERCATCNDTGWITAPGKERRVTACGCRKKKSESALLSRIAPRDAWATLDNLQPHSRLLISVPVQAKLLAAMRLHPDASYFLCGP